MANERRVCRYFAASGKCRFGAKCKFAHERNGQGRSSTSNKLPPNLVRWRNTVEGGIAVTESSLGNVLREAQTLLDSGSTDAQHEVVKTLASEHGTRLVRQVSLMPKSSLRNLLFPFLQVLTHADIMSSLVLEQHVGTIYNVLYGINGVIGTKFFRDVNQIIAEPGTAESRQLLACALEAFSRMIAINQNAAVTESIKTVALEFEVSGRGILDVDIPQDFIALSSVKSWKAICKRLEIGAQIPDASNRVADIATKLAEFHIQRDLPGDLCRTGPRHDNDKVDVRSIQILPTAEEIQSSLSEYLPSRDPRELHLIGARGLLDRQFRLLREDTVGQLRDAVRQLITDDSTNQGVQRRNQGTRTNIFHNATISGSFWDFRLGLLHLVEFQQPVNKRSPSAAERRRAWADSRDLSVDSCVCLVTPDNQVQFYSVAERNPDAVEAEGARSIRLDKSKLGGRETTLFAQPWRAAIVLKQINLTAETASAILEQQNRHEKAESTLIEFPGVLLASFNYTLEALKNMAENDNLPFSDILAPDRIESTPTSQSEPPQYATRAGFQFDLSRVTKGEPMQFSPGRLFDQAKFTRASGLDDSQTQAFLHALSSKFALIQGPPGTGKSFVGVQLIQSLLQNKDSAKLGPIFCVCYTNHALDQILEHLTGSGVEQVIRIGGRSKSEALADVNLANVSSRADRTKNEKSIIWHAYDELEAISKDAGAALGRISSADSVRVIRRYLQSHHRAFYAQFFGEGKDDDGFEEVRYDPEKSFSHWLKGGSRDPEASVRDNLRASDISSMTHRERQALLDSWVKDVRTDAMMEIRSLCTRFLRAKKVQQECHDELSLRCLRHANIIGVTTTGLAKNFDLLKKLRSKVLIVEEAAEVLEAHMLPALIPSLEHVIAIGDHQQLRPQTANYELSVENPRGAQYSLDVSLFERLIYPEHGLPSIPYATLQTQRRMHPKISRLIRATLYPELRDAPSVSEYPEVVSMRHRMFWLDHQNPETDDEMSKSNDSEVELAAALVSHLFKQGVYGKNRITVLTPYLAQFRKLRRRFSGAFEIVVGDRDQEELIKAGMDEDNDTHAAQRASLGTQLRISTIDNYQGEESDIIVVSLVRSNETGKVGFLRTSNRINVLLSRARHAMYIIGNSSVAQGVDMWRQVIAMFEAEGAIGPALPLFCPRHPESTIEVSTPDDFSRLVPEGGCNLICNQRLKCGHSCINKCHAQHLHDTVVCQSPCPRVPQHCSHPCRKICGFPCDEKCQAKVQNIPLPCGHVAAQLKCFESQAVEDVRCKQIVPKVVPRCGHTVDVCCSTDVTHKDYRCNVICGSPLSCGHACSSSCHQCNIIDDQGEKHIRHPECRKTCDRPHTTCSHRCQQPCHADVPCGPCKQPCAVSCAHSKCSKECSEPCAPCAEPCTWKCEHQGRCKLPCSVPCSRLPCSERCMKNLPCGHQCPSVCGEVCPSQKFCQQCGDEEILNMTVDFIMLSDYRDHDLADDPILVPACGHMQTLSSFDGNMDLKKYYVSDEQGRITSIDGKRRDFDMSDIKSCPSCRGPLRSINRYNRIVKQGLIDEATKRFIVWANATFIDMEKQGHELEKKLDQTVGSVSFSAELRTRHDSVLNHDSIDLRGSSTNIIGKVRSLPEPRKRYADLCRFRKQLAEFTRNVALEEQPFRRVWDLCRSSHKEDEHSDESFAAAAESASNTRNPLLARSLLLHTDANILNDLVEIWTRCRVTSPAMRALSTDTSQARGECLDLHSEAAQRDQPMQQVEALLNFAFFAAAEIRCPEDSKKTEDLREDALERLDVAAQIVESNPSTAALGPKVGSARKALTGVFQSTVTDDEMRAVYAAMATNFTGTGHWYRCANGHPFTIGECGMPMEVARCPACGAQIGGQNHQATDGVQAAGDIERQFG